MDRHPTPPPPLILLRAPPRIVDHTESGRMDHAESGRAVRRGELGRAVAGGGVCTRRSLPAVEGLAPPAGLVLSLHCGPFCTGIPRLY